ncbi:MAG: sigma-70 family RNA polymerase sigma factor [Solirubrobacteraceae bacterium]
MSVVAQRVTQGEPSYAEDQLVAAVRRGEDRAFEELYSRYCSRIGSYILGMVGDHGRAEDITQEVFISALRRLRATERPIAFKPWIYEIAKNACIDEFRRSRRIREVSMESQHELADGESGLVSGAPTPELAVEGKQRLDDLCGAFGDLSERHHQILVLRELEGLSYGQIAERMGMSRSVVESSLFRARRRLRQEYDELRSGRRCAQVQTVIDSGATPELRTLRVRERRQFARHLAHCQPCRLHARMASFDISSLATPSRIPKLAGLLPFPLPWLHWRRATVGHGVLSRAGSHPLLAAQPLQAGARLTDVVSSSTGLWTVAVAGTVAIAGLGGSLVAQSGPPAPRHGARVSGAPAGSAGRGSNAAGSGRASAAVGKLGGERGAGIAGTSLRVAGRSVPNGLGGGPRRILGSRSSATGFPAGVTLKRGAGGAPQASARQRPTTGSGPRPGLPGAGQFAPSAAGSPRLGASVGGPPAGGSSNSPRRPGSIELTVPPVGGLPPVSVPALPLPKVVLPPLPHVAVPLRVALPPLHVALPPLHVGLPALP